MAQTKSYRINCNLCGQRAGVSIVDGMSFIYCLSCDSSDELGVALQAATRKTLLQDLHDDLMQMFIQNTDKPALFPALTVLPVRASRWSVASSSSHPSPDYLA